MIITEAFVSKGYNGAPAIKFFDPEGGSQIANFRIGKKVYDKKEKDGHRWLNFSVKAFNGLCERIKSMKLKEGSCINIIARYDEDSWPDKDTGEERTGVVLYLEEIEYAGGGGQKNDRKNGQNGAPQEQQSYPQGQPQQQGYPQTPPQGYPQGQPQQQGYPQMPPQGYPQGQPPQGYPQNQQPPASMPGNFTGFEGMSGGGNPYY